MMFIEEESLYRKGNCNRFFSDSNSKWYSGHYCGNVKFTKKEIIIKPHFSKRSEHRVVQTYEPESLKKYKYSFKLSGDFSKDKTIILQFHDYWDVPNNVVAKKEYLYLATPPPVAFSVKEDSLFVEHNEIKGEPFFDHKNEWLCIPDRQLSNSHVMKLKTEVWIDLDIEIFWSLKRKGYVKCNGKKIMDNIITMFNKNPCNIQFGLYMGTSFESIKIRELTIC